MAYPATRFLWFVPVGAFFSGAAGAREPAPASPELAAEVSPAPERAVSAHVAGLLAAATPHFEVVKPAERKSGGPPGESASKPANEIVRLPNFVVKEPRIPSPEDVRTPRGLEVYAMNKYLGSPTGFSRGVLNHYTIAGAWKRATKHVPILNRFEWFSSPEKSAVDRYYDDEVRKKMRDLGGLLVLKEDSSGVPEKSDPVAVQADGSKLKK